MKKKFAGLLAALLVLSMGTTVFAADSPSSASTMEQKAQQLRDSVTVSDDKVAVTTVSTEDLTEVNTKAASESTDAEVLGMVDLKVQDGTDVSKGITVTFYVSGVASGDNIRLLHKLTDGTWEVIAPVVGDGYVKATFYSFSPVAIVKYPADVNVTPTQKPANVDGDSSGSTTVTNSGNASGNTAITDSGNTTNNAPANTSTTGNANTNGNTSTNGSDSGANSSSTSGDSTSNADSNSSASADNTQNVTVNVTGSTGGGSTSGSSATTSPKTGSSVPALPIIAVFALMGIAVCGKKARSL